MPRAGETQKLQRCRDGHLVRDADGDVLQTHPADVLLGRRTRTVGPMPPAQTADNGVPARGEGEKRGDEQRVRGDPDVRERVHGE